MRSDFSNQRNSNRSKGWTKSRLVRALIFILLGFAIGFWLNQKPKPNDQGPTDLASQKVNTKPEQITQKVELPQLELS